MKWIFHGYRKVKRAGTQEKYYLAVFKLTLAPVFRALRPSFDTATEALAYGKRIEARIKRDSA